jgi:two-component system LytT family response regulator
MIRAIVIDDEPLMQKEVQRRLTSFYLKDIAVVGTATSVADGVLAINTFEPDLIFLDVHLNDGTGFDILEQCTYKGFNVIFITGYDHNAIRAIRVGALDYILKPIDDNEFKSAVDKAISDNNDVEAQIEKQHVQVSRDHFNGTDRQRIVLKTTDGVYALQEEDIFYCKSDGNYTTVITKSQGEILVSKHIKKIEELLSEGTFVRCHQSYVVNRNHVLKYSKRGFLLLKDNSEIPVAARRRDFTLKHIF